MSAVHGPMPCSAVSAACASVGVHVADGGEIDAPFGDGLADFLDRLDLGRRQAKPLELVGARAAHRVVMKRIEGGEQPVADGRGAGRRQLLAADDGAQAGKAGLAPAQAEGAGLVGDRLEPRIGQDQLRQAGLQIGVGVKEVGHALIMSGIQ